MHILEAFQNPYAQPKGDKSFTVKTLDHIPFLFCFYIKRSFDHSFSEFMLYRGIIVVEIFVKTLKQYAARIYHKYLKLNTQNETFN